VPAAGTPVANAVTCTSVPPIGGIYTRKRVVRPLNAGTLVVPLDTPSGNSNKAEVEVYVTFNDASGNPQTVRAVTVISRISSTIWKARPIFRP